MQDIAQIIKFLTLYYFIFECRDFYDKIKSETVAIYLDKKKRMKIFRLVVMIASLILQSSNVGISFYEAVINDYPN